ncbi:MAG TPA: M56 family metallopeptidase [Solirubrobacteraceae bacterium]|nr:M56 family metallopeptidase [Solirubrobacteraceae bacterium]
MSLPGRTVRGATVAASPVPRRATLAATRVSRAGALLGALGAGSSMFAISRLFESWRVTSTSASHSAVVLGLRLSYPTANLPAVAVVAFAALGLAVISTMIAGATRELAADRRLRRSLLASRPRPIDGAFLIDDDRPRAFCAGLFKPRVYVSSGALALLDDDAVRAVLGHERHHARRYDPLRLACARVIVRALVFVPGRRHLARRLEALTELSADESAIIAAPDGRSALARAMLGFSGQSRMDDPSGIDSERVDHLLGDWEPPSPRFPAAVCVVALSVIGLLVALAALGGRVASGSATLAPPLLSHQPCVVMLALIPGLVAVGAVYLRRCIVDRDAAGRPPSGREPRHQDRRGCAGARRQGPVRR